MSERVPSRLARSARLFAGADPVAPEERLRELCSRYTAVRALTERLCGPLGPEDQSIQSMPDVSPAKWHRAHTTWFFETFVLRAAEPEGAPFDPTYEYLFNSYYNSVGAQYPRSRRGLLSRPTAAEVGLYRDAVDARMLALLSRPRPELWPLLDVVELGVHHEQQHQELLLTDIKHVFAQSPLFPALAPACGPEEGVPPALRWIEHEERLAWLGAETAGFAFDNERPRHRSFVERFALASRLVTNAELVAFVEDGGYTRPELWLADGWDTVQHERWTAPLYWIRDGSSWQEFTLGGLRPLEPATPVCHVSGYEADAYARWAGARLPREAELEIAARSAVIAGNLLESGLLHPAPAPDSSGRAPAQLYGDAWEWTQSAHAPYPGYAPPAGALGEYNGKFMSGRWVLRGGSCLTPRDHLRPTYRNFFPPDARWQMSGIRLARDA